MRHGVDGDRARLDLVEDGVALVALDEAVDHPVEGGGEEQRLVRAPHVAQHPLDLGQEAHVGHAIGLVEHHCRDVCERDRLAVDEVDEAAGCGDDELGTRGEALHLAVHVGAAVDRLEAVSACLDQRDQDLAHLEGQLAGGDQHQGSGLARLGRLEPLDQREAEGEGLARPGLGLAAHVATGQAVGNREALDREGLGDPLLGEDLHQVRGDAEGVEGGGGFRV